MTTIEAEVGMYGLSMAMLYGKREDLPACEIEDLSDRDASWLSSVYDEFRAGLHLMADQGPCVTVYGASRIQPGTEQYELGRAVGRELAKAGFTTVTGGGPGLMEAANRGAMEGGGQSIGLAISLRYLEPPNNYTTRSITFRYFFVRKTMLVKYATGFVLLPGGLGTLDEMFDTLNLIQTGKIHPFPVVLVGRSHWEGLIDWMRDCLEERGFLAPQAMELFVLTDDPAAVAQIIKTWTETHDPALLDEHVNAVKPLQISAQQAPSAEPAE